MDLYCPEATVTILEKFIIEMLESENFKKVKFL